MSPGDGDISDDGGDGDADDGGDGGGDDGGDGGDDRVNDGDGVGGGRHGGVGGSVGGHPVKQHLRIPLRNFSVLLLRLALGALFQLVCWDHSYVREAVFTEIERNMKFCVF